MQRVNANHGSWAQVDTTDDPAFFIRFLDATRYRLVAAAREDPTTFFAYLDVHPGQQVLDAACGTGDLTAILASMVAPDGEAVGLDFSATMVEEATRRTQGADLPVRFVQGDIMALPFPDNSFDRARAEQVLQHITSPETAIAELLRVTRPGGLIAIMEPDWDTLVIDADDLSLSRAFTTCHSTRLVPHGAIGRRLPALFRDAGLLDVAVTATVLMPPYPPLKEWIETTTQTVVAEGFMSEREAVSWLSELERRHTEGRFFGAFSYFQVTGQAPNGP